jgi:aminoglycoside phosphotransferase (APT) family kinase protein
MPAPSPNEPDDLAARSRRLAAELGLCAADQVVSVTPLTGGVASDIAVVDLGNRRLCMKFALPKLKVAADWFAPVHRNAAEYAWLKVAAALRPECAPALFGRSEALSGFAMEFIAGDDVYLWKAALLAGAPDRGEAAKVGALLGSVHAASGAPGFDTAPFQNHDDFRALRIEPYLTFTAGRHPVVADRLCALAETLGSRTEVLVHGDVSPKNILFRQGNPVILDAECATMGDAAFDPAFCLNHLILKAIHLETSRDALLASVGAFWRSYAPHVAWEPPRALERRVAGLIPALMLARVDGKSPVEYLAPDDADRVRNLALTLLQSPPPTLADLTKTISDTLKGQAA